MDQRHIVEEAVMTSRVDIAGVTEGDMVSFALIDV